MSRSQGALAAPELVDKVLAVVNKDVVLASQQEALVQKVKASRPGGSPVPPDDVTLHRQALDRLIQESLQLAERRGSRSVTPSWSRPSRHRRRQQDDPWRAAACPSSNGRADLCPVPGRGAPRSLMNEVRHSQVRRRINISEAGGEAGGRALGKQGPPANQSTTSAIQVALPDSRAPSKAQPARPRSNASWPP